MKKVSPEMSWKIHNIIICSSGIKTNALASQICREKTNQKYNTSDAENYNAQKLFKRQHPALVNCPKNGNFESLFSPKSNYLNTIYFSYGFLN